MVLNSPLFKGLCAAPILGYFLWIASASLKARFAIDDPMNMGIYWQMGMWKILWANLLFCTSAYRPMGGLFYMPIFHVARLNPLPYHIVLDAIVLGNTVLVYHFARLLEAPKAVAGLASLVAVSHAAILTVYFFPSELYDVLCVFFYCSCFVYYLRIRQKQAIPHVRQTFIFLAMYICALNSKELAVTLPVLIVIYELLYHRAGQLSWYAPAISVLITIAYILGKMLGPASLSRQAAYHPLFTAGRFLSNNVHYLDNLFYRKAPFFDVPRMCILWMVLLVRVLFKREKYLQLCWCFTLLSPLPIAFIPQRGGFSLYLPLVGWAVLAAAVVWDIACTLTWPRLRLALIGAVVFLWIRDSAWRASFIIAATPAAQEKTWNAIEQLRLLNLPLPHGAKVLFLNDAFETWDMYFIATLWYDDPSLHFFLERQPPVPSVESMDYILDWKENRLVVAKRPVTEVEMSSAGIIDDASPRIRLAGAWAKGIYPKAFNRTVTYSNEPGAKVTTDFTGSTLTYVYTKASNRGMAQVIIDGTDYGIVDLFSPETEWQARTVFSGLAPGVHTVELKVLHQRRKAASDYNVDLDAFLTQ